MSIRLRSLLAASLLLWPRPPAADPPDPRARCRLREGLEPLEEETGPSRRPLPWRLHIARLIPDLEVAIRHRVDDQRERRVVRLGTLDRPRRSETTLEWRVTVHWHPFAAAARTRPSPPADRVDRPHPRTRCSARRTRRRSENRLDEHVETVLDARRRRALRRVSRTP